MDNISVYFFITLTFVTIIENMSIFRRKFSLKLKKRRINGVKQVLKDVRNGLTKIYIGVILCII